jgi:hypothetical protein
MRMTRTIMLLAIATLALSLTAGCGARQHTRGSLPSADQIALVSPGVHGREDVRAVLGAPSIVSTFDENIWYYIGRRTSQWAFFERNIVENERPRPPAASWACWNSFSAMWAVSPTPKAGNNPHPRNIPAGCPQGNKPPTAFPRKFARCAACSGAPKHGNCAALRRSA